MLCAAPCAEQPAVERSPGSVDSLAVVLEEVDCAGPVEYAGFADSVGAKGREKEFAAGGIPRRAFEEARITVHLDQLLASATVSGICAWPVRVPAPAIAAHGRQYVDQTRRNERARLASRCPVRWRSRDHASSLPAGLRCSCGRIRPTAQARRCRRAPGGAGRSSWSWSWYSCETPSMPIDRGKNVAGTTRREPETRRFCRWRHRRIRPALRRRSSIRLSSSSSGRGRRRWR